MKTKLLTCLALLFSATAAHALPMVSSPVSLSATVTSSDGPYYAGSKATVRSAVRRFGNGEIIQEAVRVGLIPSSGGWNIVCRYDAHMEELLLADLPSLWLKNGSKLVALDPVLRLEQLGTTATGTASANAKTGKVAGTLKRQVLYRLVANFERYDAVSYGQIAVSMKIAGTENNYYAVAGAGTLTMSGYVEGEIETLVAASLKFGAFTVE